MEPDFALMMTSAVVFALLVLAFTWWRFGGINTLLFVIFAGLFTALLDFVSAFVAQNYEYPGQSRVWVFWFIFFGWIGMCGSCLFIAEGILAGPRRNMLTQPSLWWQVPLLTAIIAVVFDLFIDPIAVRAGYWRWFVKGEIYYGIPLLNYVGWFVLMLLAPLGWIMVAQQSHWGSMRKLLVALLVLIPLAIAAVVLSMLLNGLFNAMGLQ